MNEPGTPAQDLYEALVTDQLRVPGVGIGKALHNEVLTAGGKIFAFLKDDRLVVKLPASRAAALVAGGEAAAFESGGRKMREWVSAALPADPGRWRLLMADAHEYVSGLQA
jgi:hypothetical protein